jgi:hypothetical protein
MKFIGRAIIRILILFVILIIPVGFFITFFALNQKNIPIWNIGIRNVLSFAGYYSVPIVAISYFIATLITVSLVDKMKIRSLILLHIPPVLIGAALIGGFYMLQVKRQPFKIIEHGVRLGYGSFLKEGVFNEVGNRAIMIEKNEQNRFTLYVYNRENNDLFVLGTLPRSSISIDRAGQKVSFTSGKRKIITYTVPFKDFHSYEGVADNRIIQLYVNQLRKTVSSFRKYFQQAEGMERFLFLGAVFISMLMISIPLTYALNDGGWGFSGITGAIFIVLVLPFLYGGIFFIIQKMRLSTSFLGSYAYLFPAVVFALVGIVLDIAVKVKSIKKGI